MGSGMGGGGKPYGRREKEGLAAGKGESAGEGKGYAEGEGLAPGWESLKVSVEIFS